MGYLPAALLLLVAFFHAANVERYSLTPWKGGGFAMFSTADAPSERVTQVRLIDAQGSAGFAVLPDSAREAERRFRTMPSPDNARQLANRLLKTDWRCAMETNDDGTRAPATAQLLCRERHPHSLAPLRPIQTLELSLFTTELGPSAHEARSRLLHHSQHSAAPTEDRS